MIAVSFALPAESRGFLKHVKGKRRNRESDVTTIDGIVGQSPVVIFHTGVGRKTCEHRIARFLEMEKPRVWISAGFAGALHDEIHAADLLIGSNFSDHRLLAPVQDVLITHRPRLVKLQTLPVIVDSPTQRHELAHETGAAAMDMETHFIATACAAKNIPLLSIRTISDSLAEPFPAPPEVLFDIEKQKTSAIALTSYLIGNPGALRRLMKFSRQISRAREVLTAALVEVITSDVLQEN